MGEPNSTASKKAWEYQAIQKIAKSKEHKTTVVFHKPWFSCSARSMPL
jgi:hypothetical protein